MDASRADTDRCGVKPRHLLSAITDPDGPHSSLFCFHPCFLLFLLLLLLLLLPHAHPQPTNQENGRKWKKRETIHQFRPSREERKSTGTSYKHSIFPPPEIRLIITEYSSLTDPIPESTNILTTTNNSSFQITLNNNNNNININQCGCWQTFHLQLPDLCY